MVILTLIALAVILLLIMLASIWGMNFAMARLVGDRHQALQALIETGQAPPAWSQPFQRKIARLTASPGNAAQLAKVQARAHRHYLRELDRLVHYVQTSALVDGEETRSLLLEKLAAIRVGWQEKIQQ